MQENQSAAQKKTYPSRDDNGNGLAEQLRGNHDTFFNVVKNAPFGIYVVDSDFRLMQISAGAKKVFSHVDPLIGRDFAEVLRCLWQEPFATEFIGRFRHTLATGEAYHSADTTGLRNDVDDEESYDWKIERITLPDGSYGVVCYFYDLTERQQFAVRLRESEERMSLVLRSANVGILTIDLKDKTIYRSPEYYAAFGATEADNTYDGLTRFVHPDDLAEIQRQFDEAVHTAVPYQAEFRIIRDDGVIRWLGNLGNTEYDEDGTPARFFNTIFDITERKQRELNQVFVGEMDRVLAGMMNTDHIIRIACEKIGEYLRVANCTLAEVDTEVNTAIVGQVWCRDQDAVDFSGFYDLAGFVSESYRRALIAGRSVVVKDVTDNEVTAGFSDKFLALKIGSFVNTPFLSEGRLKYLLNIYDTTPRMWLPWEVELLESLIPRIRLRIERGRAQQKLRESEERLSLIVESVSDYAIITIDDKGSITGWNAAAQSIYGYSPDEMVGANFATLFQEDDIKKNVPQAELELARTAGRAPDDRWMVRKDGSTFYASGFTSKFESRGEAGFVKIIQDLTIKIETEKLQRQQELLENIVKSQEAERHRIARDLHDHLGQRITALRFALNALKTNDKDSVATGEHIEKIEELALQLDRDATMLAFELRPSVLEDVRLEEALQSYVEEWSANTGVAAEVRASTSHEKRFEPAIETNLFRIAQEALNNVAKHARASRVNVMVEKRQDQIVLILEDDGVGYDRRDRPEQVGGGFGLVGMRERAAILGGVLEIETAPNRGTTIYVTVPAK